MSRIRYLAAMSAEPARLAHYYVRYFGMRIFARSDEGDLSLTDGYFNLTCFKLRPSLRATEPRVGPGLNHIGLQVDSLEEVRQRYLAFNPKGIVVPEPGGPHSGTLRIHDPEFMPISLSEGSFGVEDSPVQLPRLLHIALNAFDPPRIMEFYREVFGLRPLTQTNQPWIRAGRPNRFMGDGMVNLAIHAFYTDNPGHQGRYGVNHFGFMVQGWKDLMEEIGRHYPAAPRPANRPFEDARVEDPDGNMVDLGETKGWEVDDQIWVTAI